ncbi:Ras association domain-containing protein 4 [Bagarius yarrelli]|uniref:Ras association domain-containing protein 4 n=1 Tax=Bagarius yarrelli TaxID=175774 RepID=A0A556TN27_BAGYA|nr:Ras association domain-containing protein 4 [Bagarius yarrelli]
MQDDYERIHFANAGFWRPESPGREQRNENQQIPIQLSFESNNNEVTAPARNIVDDLSSEEETPQLPRTRSDASFMNVQRRSKQRSSGDLQRVQRHRFSINGHFYNHKTPSNKHCQIVFLQVENKADEFALYIVHESGERTKIKEDEYPLVSRVLHGPCEKIAKLFIMEKDLGEEVPYDVAQYINLAMPVLNSFVTKLMEEEEREISKLTKKYGVLKSMILQQLKDTSESTDCV